MNRLHVEQQRLTTHHLGVRPHRRLVLIPAGDAHLDGHQLLHTVDESQVVLQRLDQHLQLGVEQPLHLFITPHHRPHVRRVAVQKRSALHGVLDVEVPDGGVQQSVQPMPHARAPPPHSTELLGGHGLQVLGSHHFEVALRLHLQPFIHTHLTALDVHPLELGQAAHVLEHVLVLEHHAQVDFLHDVFNAFLLCW